MILNRGVRGHSLRCSTVVAALVCERIICRVEAIAIRLEAIASRLEAIAIWLEVFTELPDGKPAPQPSSRQLKGFPLGASLLGKRESCRNQFVSHTRLLPGLPKQAYDHDSM